MKGGSLVKSSLLHCLWYLVGGVYALSLVYSCTSLGFRRCPVSIIDHAAFRVRTYLYRQDLVLRQTAIL